jgi:hypothetical protein
MLHPYLIRHRPSPILQRPHPPPILQRPHPPPIFQKTHPPQRQPNLLHHLQLSPATLPITSFIFPMTSSLDFPLVGLGTVTAMTHFMLSITQPKFLLPTGIVKIGTGVFNFGLTHPIFQVWVTRLTLNYYGATHKLIVSTVLIVKVDLEWLYVVTPSTMYVASHLPAPCTDVHIPAGLGTNTIFEYNTIQYQMFKYIVAAEICPADFEMGEYILPPPILIYFPLPNKYISTPRN